MYCQKGTAKVSPIYYYIDRKIGVNFVVNFEVSFGLSFAGFQASKGHHETFKIYLQCAAQDTIFTPVFRQFLVMLY